MERLAKNKPMFIGLSGLSLACLIGSFAYPLQKMEIWKQTEIGAFNLEYERHIILTENDQDYPYGFSPENSVKVKQIYQDYKIEKFGLLILSIFGASTALSIGHETCVGDEIDTEVEQIKVEGKKQLIIEGLKHRLAMASKSQRLLFMDEMKALVEEFGSVEGEILEGDELNALDESEMTQDEVKQTEESIDFRAVFPETMDGMTWKAICKGLGDGLNRSDIVKDVLDCGQSQRELGEAYFDHLSRRFLEK